MKTLIMIKKMLLIIGAIIFVVLISGTVYLQNSNDLYDTVKAIKYNIIKPINTVETINMSMEEYNQSYGFNYNSDYYYQKLEKEYSYPDSTYIFTSTRINYFEYNQNDIVISNKDYRGVGHFNIGLTSKYLDVLVGVYALPIDGLTAKSDVIVCYRFVDENHVKLKEKPILRIEDNDEIIDVFRYEIPSNIKVENVDISNIIWFGPLNDEGGFQLISFE